MILLLPLFVAGSWDELVAILLKKEKKRKYNIGHDLIMFHMEKLGLLLGTYTQTLVGLVGLVITFSFLCKRKHKILREIYV